MEHVPGNSFKDRIPVLRRSSGGGTVLQGKGCLNFSLVLSKEYNPHIGDLRKSYQFILGKVVTVLELLGIESKVHPVSDIALAENRKKISGNAQKRSKKYIQTRLERGESIIFLALSSDNEAMGFTQLYPTFCSVEVQNALILYDLYVAPNARRSGVATQLLTAAHQLGKETGAAWLKLETDVSNTPGQALYEKLNWERDNAFYSYYFHLKH